MRDIEGLAKVIRDEHEERERPLQLAIFRRLFGWVWPYRRVLNGLTLCVVVRSLQVPCLAWTLARVIKGPIADGYYRDLAIGLGVYTALSVFTNFTLYYRLNLAYVLGENAMHDLRLDLFTKLQTLTMHFFHGTRVGRIISRFTSDAEAIRNGLQNAVFGTVVCFGQCVVASLVMLYTDWALALAMLLAAPLYYLTYMYFRGQMSKAHREVQESYSRITANLAEAVTGMHVIQGFARQDRNAQMFRELVNDHAEYNMNVTRASGTFNPVIELMNNVVTGMIFVIGGWLALRPQATTDVESLIVFYFMAHEVLAPLVAIGVHYSTAVTAMAGAERVFRMLDREPEFRDAPDAVDLPPVRGRVELRHLTFGYHADRPVLHDVNFIAEPGQTVALVGHTGSGKTTIINLISAFYRPTSGQVLIDGHDLATVRSATLHKQMGIVLQQNFLFTGTILENILVGRPEATEEEVVEAARKLELLPLFDKLPDRFATQVGERGGSLSLGQRQMVCFARAMLADPRLLILDEATSSVDTLTESRLQQALQVLLRGRTSFVVAHRLSTIRQADVVLVLNQGRLVERGSHLELLAADGLYTKLYMQFVQIAEGE